MSILLTSVHSNNWHKPETLLIYIVINIERKTVSSSSAHWVTWVYFNNQYWVQTKLCQRISLPRDSAIVCVPWCRGNKKINFIRTLRPIKPTIRDNYWNFLVRNALMTFFGRSLFMAFLIRFCKIRDYLETQQSAYRWTHACNRRLVWLLVMVV